MKVIGQGYGKVAFENLKIHVSELTNIPQSRIDFTHKDTNILLALVSNDGRLKPIKKVSEYIQPTRTWTLVNHHTLEVEFTDEELKILLAMDLFPLPETKRKCLIM